MICWKIKPVVPVSPAPSIPFVECVFLRLALELVLRRLQNHEIIFNRLMPTPYLVIQLSGFWPAILELFQTRFHWYPQEARPHPQGLQPIKRERTAKAPSDSNRPWQSVYNQ